MAKDMLVVDADSHVEEPGEAWAHLDKKYEDRRPFPVIAPAQPRFYGLNAFWYIDGRVFPKPVGSYNSVYGTPLEMEMARTKPWTIGSQTLNDVEARLKDMDALGIDIQVNFPTLFLEPLTDDIEFEAALMRSYNTWMAKVSAERPDRLKWGAAMPMRHVPSAMEELRRARDLGAVCVVLYGTVGEVMLHNRTFDPFWAEAERLQMPLAIHTGWSHPGLHRSGEGPYEALAITFTLPVMMGFFSFLGGGILDRFPGLRVAFLEAGLDWVPYLLERMDHYIAAGRPQGRPMPRRTASEYLRDCELYFTCEAEERRLPETLKIVGEDRIMISADLPHTEARENAVQELKERTDLSETTKRRILGENPARFYRL